jgi:hypothetical protein
MARGAERLYRQTKLRRADQQIVGVESREREDADARLGQRREQRGKHAGQAEVELPFDYQAAPVSFLAYIIRRIFLRADNRKLIRRSCDRDKRG